MKRVRVIPVLTVDNKKLVKTVKFKKPNYIGDPINAVKIFNEKEVDEIVLLDITATKKKRTPNFTFIEEICSEAFMPFAYGGGITTLAQIDQLFQLGIEKVVLNSCVENNFDLIIKAAAKYGAQSIVISIDVKKHLFGKYQVYKQAGNKKVKLNLADYLTQIEQAGAGEIFINSIDKDGTYLGYDEDLIKLVTNQVNLPVVACGGAKEIECFYTAIKNGASAIAAGSLFVYRGSTHGVLINYPTQQELKEKLFDKI